MVDKIAVECMHEDADIFQSSILESRQAEHAAEVHAAEERARILHRQKKVNKFFFFIQVFLFGIPMRIQRRTKMRRFQASRKANDLKVSWRGGGVAPRTRGTCFALMAQYESLSLAGASFLLSRFLAGSSFLDFSCYQELNLSLAT